MSTLLLDRNAVNKLMRMTDVSNAGKEAFRMWYEYKANLPAKTYISIEHGDFRETNERGKEK